MSSKGSIAGHFSKGKRSALAARLGGDQPPTSLPPWQAPGRRPRLGSRRPEPKLNVLRWKLFVDAEISVRAWLQAFTKATGVENQRYQLFLDDVQPKASVRPRIWAGPRHGVGAYSLPISVRRSASTSPTSPTISGKTAAGRPSADAYEKSKGKWIAFPFAVTGAHHQLPHLACGKGRFQGVFRRTRAPSSNSAGTQAKQHARRLRARHARADANTNLAALGLWAHGGYLVDKDDKVISLTGDRQSARILQKLSTIIYSRHRPPLEHAVPHKAFLAGDLTATHNVISIYVRGQEERPDMALTMKPAYMPNRPGRQAERELQLEFPILTFAFTQVPQRLQGVRGLHAGGGQLQSGVSAAQSILSPFLADTTRTRWDGADPKQRRTATWQAQRSTRGPGRSARRPPPAIADFLWSTMFLQLRPPQGGPEGLHRRWAGVAAKRLYVSGEQGGT